MVSDMKATVAPAPEGYPCRELRSSSCQRCQTEAGSSTLHIMEYPPRGMDPGLARKILLGHLPDLLHTPATSAAGVRDRRRTMSLLRRVHWFGGRYQSLSVRRVRSLEEGRLEACERGVISCALMVEDHLRLGIDPFFCRHLNLTRKGKGIR